ncbi:hypothetical protein Bca52824_066808 [Brassica carinata]|uniref:Uncharacterized protein n=1 Tax=Brassica carinata TaxID=52824 RepID=A0A8X7QR83_BRACI|nr:hypothetical protein Bca52824_066808 [Brassica carinata]
MNTRLRYDPSQISRHTKPSDTPSSSPSRSHRRHPLLQRSLSSPSPTATCGGSTPAEFCGGTTASCAAVCCCCPCGLVNLLVLAIYKVPAESAVARYVFAAVNISSKTGSFRRFRPTGGCSRTRSSRSIRWIATTSLTRMMMISWILNTSENQLRRGWRRTMRPMRTMRRCWRWRKRCGTGFTVQDSGEVRRRENLCRLREVQILFRYSRGPEEEVIKALLIVLVS